MHTPYHSLPHDGETVFLYPLFKNKDQVVEYLSRYRDLHEIPVKYETEVTKVRFEDGIKQWVCETTDGVIYSKVRQRTALRSSISRSHQKAIASESKLGGGNRYRSIIKSICSNYSRE